MRLIEFNPGNHFMTRTTAVGNPRAHASTSRTIATSAIALLVGACASSPQQRDVWTVTESVDPITSVSRCIVAPPDRACGTAYTRTGYLYPFVENNSELGLLVGVSSGGPIRVPPGDIVWRVDDKPHRTLDAVNTPTLGTASPPVDTSEMTDVVRQSFETAMAASSGMISSIQNGTTAVDGENAQEMLAEMRAGSQLLYRSAAASQSMGLANPSTIAVGRYRDGEQEPFPLDASFESALQRCGL